MITSKKKLMFLAMFFCFCLVISAPAVWGGGGKTGGKGEPGSGCVLPDNCSAWKFVGNTYEGTLVLECETNGQPECALYECDPPEIGVSCVSVLLYGLVTKVNNIQCSGYIPENHKINWGLMEENVFKNLKPEDIRGCILGDLGYDAGEGWQYYFNCVNHEEPPFMNVYDAGKVKYQSNTVVTATVKVKEIVPTKCTY
jgi:hypothetical protein